MVQTTSDPRMPMGISRLRLLRFLRRGRHRVESDIRKEDARRAFGNAAPAEISVRVWRRNKRMPVHPGHFRMLEQEPAADDEKDADDRQLDDHDCGVEVGRLLDADHEDGCDHHDDDHAIRLNTPVACGRPASLTPGGSDITGSH